MQGMGSWGDTGTLGYIMVNGGHNSPRFPDMVFAMMGNKTNQKEKENIGIIKGGFEQGMLLQAWNAMVTF